MQVKDIMTKKAITVKSDASVMEVARLLNQHKIHGVPVTDANNMLVGIITESDFFVKNLPHLYLPSYIELLKKTEFAKRMPKEEKQKAEKLLEAKAEDIMTKDCIFVSPDLDVSKLMAMFREMHLYTVPVIDETRRVIGVVTVADIIKLI